MKSILSLLLLLSLTLGADAQLVNCRPRIAMVYYWGHNDNVSNSAMTTIISSKPDILIDNTPGGLWKGGCLPSKYTPHNIAVYSYITGGYENQTRGGDTSQLAANLLRVDAIANDGATGVFLDEVTSFPDSTRKAYITSIFNRCKSNGLNLIINPGVSSFDTSLMSICDYILTDEHYTNTRKPTASELSFLDRVIVVSTLVSNATDAANNSLRARDYGFGYSYSCYEYTAFPSWLNAYNTYITNMTPATPTVTNMGTYLQSSASFGNQWYNQSGILNGETADKFTPSANGSYYSIVTLDNCISDTSNIINVTTTSILNQNPSYNELRIYPVPAADNFQLYGTALLDENTQIEIYDMNGRLVKDVIYQPKQPIDTRDIANGIYVLVIQSSNTLIRKSLLIQK